MSDNIHFDLQIDIIKHVPDVKSLLRFRSVSKPWKSFIDSYKFNHHIEPQRSILRYKDSLDSFKEKYICLMDDNGTLTHQQELDPTVPRLIKELNYSIVVGSCDGLFCVYGVNNGRNMVVLWNPSIRKCVGMIVPHETHGTFADCGFGACPVTLARFGFGVCPVTNDPMIVRIPWVIESKQVEVFTLSSGVWNAIPSSYMYRDLIVIWEHVVIDRFIYWAGYDGTFEDNGESHYDWKILSFDMITKNFKVIDVPYSLAKQFYWGITISKLRESLVLFAFIKDKEELDKLVGCAWVMEHDGVRTSFRKLFTVDIPESINKIHGYTKTGEPIVETKRSRHYDTPAELEVYSPSSKHIFHNLGIYGQDGSLFMGSYMETLLLHDHADCFIYDYVQRSDLLPLEGS